MGPKSNVYKGQEKNRNMLSISVCNTISSRRRRQITAPAAADARPKPLAPDESTRKHMTLVTYMRRSWYTHYCIYRSNGRKRGVPYGLVIAAHARLRHHEGCIRTFLLPAVTFTGRPADPTNSFSVLVRYQASVRRFVSNVCDE